MITQYITKKCLLAALLIFMGFLVFFLIIGFAAESSAVKDDYGFLSALLYVFLNTGNLFSTIIPIMGLFVFLLVFGALAGGSELIALQASGVSYHAILRTAIIACMSVFFLLWGSNELLAPVGHSTAEVFKAQRLNKPIITGSQNVWIKKDNYFLFIKNLVNLDVLSDVKIYYFDDQSRPIRVLQAKNANRTDEETWTLYDVKSLDISHDDQLTNLNAHRSTQSELKIARLIDRDRVRFISVASESLHLWQLFKQLQHLSNNDLTDPALSLGFWRRAFSPISMLGFILILLPLFLGSTRRRGVGERLLIGLMIGIPYFVLTQLSQNISIAYNIPPFIATASIPCALLLVGLLRYWQMTKPTST